MLDSSEMDDVSHISGTERRQVVRDRHQDQSQRGEDGHDEKALSTAPDIKHLGQRYVYRGRHSVGDNVDHIEQ